MRSVIGTIRNQPPIAYVPRVQVAWPWMAKSTTEQELRAFGRNGDLFAIVSRLANAVSQVDWKLWRSSKSGNDDDRTEVADHQALRVWNKPNDFMTRQEYVEAGQQHIDLVGEGWNLVGWASKSASIPAELWPARPDRMAPVPSPDKFISGYMYIGPNGEQVPFEVDDVTMIRCPNPWDIYRGMGPVQSMLVDLDASRYSAEWNRNFFTNSAAPGGMIQMEKSLSDPEWEKFVARWREQHQGVSNAHRVAILEGGAKWVDASYSMRDMQFAELEQVASDKLLRSFGFPKFMLGEVNDVNRATAEASDAMFAKWLVVPRLERWKSMLNNDFLKLFGSAGKGVEFDYEDPVPPDAAQELAEMTAKATAAKTYIDAGFKAPSVVEALDLPDALEWEKPEPPPAPIAPPPPPGQGDQQQGGQGGDQQPPKAPAPAQPPAKGDQQATAIDRRLVEALLDLAQLRGEARARDDATPHSVRFQYDSE